MASDGPHRQTTTGSCCARPSCPAAPYRGRLWAIYALDPRWDDCGHCSSAGTGAYTSPDSESSPESHSDSDSDPHAKTCSGAHTRTYTQTCSESDSGTNARPSSKPESKTVSGADTSAGPKSHSDTGPSNACNSVTMGTALVAHQSRRAGMGYAGE